MTSFLELAAGELGVPYLYGGDSPAGFDCSGLVQWAADQIGISLPRGATDQWHTVAHVTDPGPGDLVFFNTGDGYEAGHVGICADAGCATMIDAPHTGALVRTEPVSGFAQVIGYGRLPAAATLTSAASDIGGAASDIGGSVLGGLGDVGGALGSAASDVLGPIIDALGSLPGEILKVFLGGHTLGELALRFVEVIGGALVFAAGAVTLLVVIGNGGEPARAHAGVRRAGRSVARPVRATARLVPRSEAA